MTLVSEIVARRLRLPVPQTTDVLVEADLPVRADDGVVLLTNRYVPRTAAAGPNPTLLVRSPYGRAQAFGLLFGRLMAERGLQVVLQSVRGSFGSGGKFTPFQERADGLATLRWLREQPWHDGRVGTAGMSYLGLTQWAIADQPEIVAMAPQLTASSFHEASYGGGSLSLDLTLTWMTLIGLQEERMGPLLLARALRGKIPELLDHLPLDELDDLALGEDVPYFHEWLRHPGPGDEYWDTRVFEGERDASTAAIQLLSGWNDLFTPSQFDDHEALVAAGKDVSLVVGPWSHAHPGALGTGLRETLAFMRKHLLGDDRMLRPGKVRVYVTGAREWRTYETWPPAGTTPQTLAPGGEGTVRFDPMDPTPAVGGPVLLGLKPIVDNAPLEARDDVLVLTGEPLDAPLEVIGPVEITVDVTASGPHFDVFARLCEVGADGVSRNVTDGLRRVEGEGDGAATPPDGSDEETGAPGPTRVAVRLWPVAHRFAAGSRLRLLLAGGAHPRFARNMGTDEDPALATDGVAVDLAFSGAEVSYMRNTP